MVSLINGITSLEHVIPNYERYMMSINPIHEDNDCTEAALADIWVSSIIIVQRVTSKENVL